MEHTFYRRLLSAVCAIALAFTAVCPAVAAAPEETTGTPQTLTASEVKEMQQTDAAVTALTDSAAYAGMSEEERQVAALAQLDELAAQGLVKKDSIYVDAKNGMVSFTYSCGALGGILLTDTESEADAALPGPEMEDAPALLAAENGTVGNAVIYYAFDNGGNSNRYPYYSYMKDYWNGYGLDTHLDMMVTVSDLKRMADYDLAVLSGSGSDDGLEHGTAAGEDDLSAVGVPAGDHGLQLGGSLEGSAVLPGVVQVDGLIHFLSSVVGTLSKAPAVTDAGGVRAAAAAGEAELLIAFLDDSVTGQIAALLFLEGDTGNVLQNGGAVNAGFLGDGITIHEHEGDIGELLGGHAQSAFLHEAGADNHLGAVLHGGLHGLVTVIIGGLVLVGGLIILIGQLVVGSVQLHAVIGALVEGLILQLAHVGDESDLVLAILGGHLIVDLIGIGDGLGLVGIIVAIVGVLGGLLGAGCHRQDHDHSKEHCQKLFHGESTFLFNFGRETPLISTL